MRPQFLERPDGSVVPVALNGAPLIVSGKILGCVLALHDMTREQDFIDRTLHTGNYAPFDERASTSKLRQHQGATPDAGKPNIGAPNFGGGAGKGAAELAAAQRAGSTDRAR